MGLTTAYTVCQHRIIEETGIQSSYCIAVLYRLINLSFLDRIENLPSVVILRDIVDMRLRTVRSSIRVASLEDI